MKTKEQEDAELLEHFTNAIVEIMDACEEVGIEGTFAGPVPAVGMVKQLAECYKALRNSNLDPSIQ